MCTPFETPDGFLLLDAAQFALGDKPALTTYGAQDTTLGNFLSEPPEQLLLRLIRA
jgi:hypothetical protein